MRSAEYHSSALSLFLSLGNCACNCMICASQPRMTLEGLAAFLPPADPGVAALVIIFNLDSKYGNDLFFCVCALYMHDVF